MIIMMMMVSVVVLPPFSEKMYLSGPCCSDDAAVVPELQQLQLHLQLLLCHHSSSAPWKRISPTAACGGCRYRYRCCAGEDKDGVVDAAAAAAASERRMLLLLYQKMRNVKIR